MVFLAPKHGSLPVAGWGPAPRRAGCRSRSAGSSRFGRTATRWNWHGICIYPGSRPRAVCFSVIASYFYNGVSWLVVSCLSEGMLFLWSGLGHVLFWGSVYYWRRAAGQVSPRRARYFSCAAKKSTQKKAAPAACDPSRCEGQPVSWHLRGVPRNSLRAESAPFGQTRQASGRCTGTLRCQCHPANVTPQAHAKGGIRDSFFGCFGARPLAWGWLAGSCAC
jgi:hypothetical protein